MRTPSSGFTLVEMLIAVIIIGILTTIALPSYQLQVTKSRRGEAQAALLSFANAMERHFVRNNSYLGAGVSAANTGAPASTLHVARVPNNGDTYYSLTIQTASATAYTLRADPQGAQDDDGYMELTSLGVRRRDHNNDGDTDDSGETHW